MRLSVLTLKKQTAESAENMVKNAMKVFETSDVELVKTTATEDDRIDELFYKTWLS